MPDVTHLIEAAAAGDPTAAAGLSPLAYDELRRLTHHLSQDPSRDAIPFRPSHVHPAVG